jgi:hypothetical protein
MTSELDRRARASGRHETHSFVDGQSALGGEIVETGGHRFITLPKVWGVADAYEIGGRLVSALAVITSK